MLYRWWLWKAALLIWWQTVNTSHPTRSTSHQCSPLLLFVDISQRSHVNASRTVIVPGLMMEYNITWNWDCLFKQRGSHQGHNPTSHFPPTWRCCGETSSLRLGCLHIQHSRQRGKADLGVLRKNKVKPCFLHQARLGKLTADRKSCRWRHLEEESEFEKLLKPFQKLS